MRSGWLQKTGRVLLVLGLACGPWPSGFAAVQASPPAHAAQSAAAAEPAMAEHCPGHASAAKAAATAPGSCCDDDAGCAAAACVSPACGSTPAASLPPAVAAMRILAAGTDAAAWIWPSRREPFARERLRPPIA